jgi:hypothetical protein
MGEIERMLKRAYRRKIRRRMRAKYRAKYPPVQKPEPWRALHARPSNTGMSVSFDGVYRCLLWQITTVHPADRPHLVFAMSQEWFDEVERILRLSSPVTGAAPAPEAERTPVLARIFDVSVLVREGAGAPHLELR